MKNNAPDKAIEAVFDEVKYAITAKEAMTKTKISEMDENIDMRCLPVIHQSDSCG